MASTGSLSPSQDSDEKKNSSIRSGSRRGATHYSADDTARLEAVYARDRYPDYVTREHLAFLLQRTEMQVQTWFQNRRCRDRKSAHKLPPPLKLDPSIVTSCAVKTPTVVVDRPVLQDYDDPSDLTRRYRTAMWCSAHAVTRHESVSKEPLDLSNTSPTDSTFPLSASSKDSSNRLVFSFLQQKPLAVVSPVSSGLRGRAPLLSSTPITSYRRPINVLPPELLSPHLNMLPPTPNNSQTSDEQWSLPSSVSTNATDSIFFSGRCHVTLHSPQGGGSSPGQISDGASASPVSYAATDSDSDVSTSGRPFVPVRPWEDKPGAAKPVSSMKPSLLRASQHSASTSSLSLSARSIFGHTSPITTPDLINSSNCSYDLVRSPQDWIWSEMMEKYLSSPPCLLSPVVN